MRNQFSNEDISRGIVMLTHKISKISIFSHILDQYFDDFIITRRTAALSLVLTELVAHIYGQLARLCFDKATNYKTASINEIFQQIRSSPNFGDAKGIAHKNEFDELADKIQLLADYKQKLTLYCNKHYAHLEIMSEDETRNDYADFKMSWNEITILIKHTKEILNTMNLFWDNSGSDFSENQYMDFKNRFWELICLPDRDSSEFWT